MTLTDKPIYPSQTKILEGLTKGEIKIFDIPFKGVSTRFGLQTIEKYIENLDFIFCQSFQNLRLGSIQLPTTRLARGKRVKMGVRVDLVALKPPKSLLVVLIDSVASRKVAVSALGRNGSEKRR